VRVRAKEKASPDSRSFDVNPGNVSKLPRQFRTQLERLIVAGESVFVPRHLPKPKALV